MRTISVPERFFDDHEERELATPAVLKRGAGYVRIAFDDPAIPELLSDAEHYATGGLDMAPSGVVASAKATVKRIKASGWVA